MDCGILLYREDFAGNNLSDPIVSPTDLSSGYSDLTFSETALFHQGYYSLTKSAYHLFPSEYHRASDHTFPNDTTRGYFMFAHSGDNEVNHILYQTDIDNLCDGMTLSFTAWYMDINKLPVTQALCPKIEMQMLNSITNDILITTGDITIVKGNLWKQYGFNFDLPSGITNVKFRILNKEPSGHGNDLGIDDIEIRACVPQIDIIVPTTLDTVVCSGSPIALRGLFEDDGTFGNNLTYRWEYSLTGDANDPVAWTSIFNSTGTNPLDVNYMIASMSETEAGYYRLLVGASSSINNPKCRSMSSAIKVEEKPLAVLSSELSKTICSETSVSYQATSATSNATFSWTRADVAGITPLTGTGMGDFISEILTNNTENPINVTYVISITANGCTNTQNVTVTVDPILVISMPKSDIYINETITLPPQSNGIWESSNNAIATITDDGVVTGVAAGMVTFTYTDTTTGCKASTTMLTVLSLPVYLSICEGESVTFTANIDNGGTSPVYQWQKNKININGETNPTYTYTPQNNDTISCLLTSDATCANPTTVISNTVIITVNPRPEAPVLANNANTSVCDGETIDAVFLATLIDYDNTTLTAEYYTDAACTEEFTSITTNYSVTQSHMIYVIARDNATECATPSEDAYALTITVNARPAAPTLVNVANNVLCEGETIDAAFLESLINVTSGTTAEIYTDAACTTAFSSVTATVPSHTFYVISRNYATGCATSTSAVLPLTITVNEYATASQITVSGTTTICENTTTTLTASSIGITNPVYTWYDSVDGDNVLGTGAEYTTLSLT
jgi:hypothetical protein